MTGVWRDAAKEGLRHAFDGRSRMPRGVFWRFALIAILPPIAFATQVNWLVIEMWGIWKVIVLMILAIPFLNAIARRLNDAGEDGTAAFWPFMPFIILWVAYQLVYWIGIALAAVGGGFLTVIIFLFALLILVPLHIVALVASLIATAHILGHLLVSSEADTNKYGPNPHEVTP